MGPALRAADVVLSRSGSQIFEIAAFGKPMILIPHKAGNDHQRANAYAFRQQGAAVVIEENELFPAVLKKQIMALTREEGRAMGNNARTFYQNDATEHLASVIIEYIKK
jgi:UDP-N-acetylglucosamine--N-acetylmuramyl-(pentapeptide) pyrophosphoryl-undecaprenol N-acetylglucosamine transferase